MKNSRLISILLAAVFLCDISYAQIPSYLPTNGLVAWYPFNGNANDESGNGNDGVVHGATLCADKVANASSAYDFSGADSYIEIASSPIQSQGSLMAWVFPRSAAAVNNNWNYSASLIDQNIDAQNNSGIGLYYHNTIHGLYAEIGWSGNSNNFINANPIQPLALADWQQVVFTFSQGSCSLYLNGELIATKNNMNAAGLGTAHLFLGRAPWGGNQFNGILDDIAIYNRALTPTEVTALFTATPTNNGGGTSIANQAPPGIPYQAEVRNENGELLANANVNVRFTLHELTANGTVSYQETHAITTNEFGLFAATIGVGTAAQGTFAGINWSQTTKFLQVEVDAGNGYITMGNQQLMSVPYALYAANGPVGPVGPQGPAGADGVQGPMGPSGPTSSGSFSHYIGEFYQGGIICQLWKDSTLQEHGIICSFNNQSDGASFGCGGWMPAFSFNDYISNNGLLIPCSQAAQLCANYVYLNYDDWHLPTIDELRAINQNLQIINERLAFDNNSSTTPISMQSYWSSTSRYISSLAYFLNFETNTIGYTDRSNLMPVRAVRRF